MAFYSSLRNYLDSTVPGIWSIRFRSWLPAVPLIGSWLSSFFPPVDQKLVDMRVSLDAGNDDYILLHTGTAEKVEKIELFNEHEKAILKNNKIKRYALLEEFENLSVLCRTDIQLADLQKDIQFLLALEGTYKGKKSYQKAAAYLAVHPLFIHEIKNLSFESEEYAKLFNTHFHNYRLEKIKDLAIQGDVYKIQNFCEEKTCVDDIKLLLTEGAGSKNMDSMSAYYQAAAFLAVHFYKVVDIDQITRESNYGPYAPLIMHSFKKFKNEKIKEFAESSLFVNLVSLCTKNHCRQDVLFLLTTAKEEKRANLQKQYYQAAEYLVDYYCVSPQADDDKILSDFLRHISIKKELTEGSAIADLCTQETCYDDIRFLTKESLYEAAYSLINRFKLTFQELKIKVFNNCQSNEDNLLYDNLHKYCKNSKLKSLVLEDKLEEMAALYTKDSCYEGIKHLLTSAATSDSSKQTYQYNQAALYLFRTFELTLENLVEKFDLEPTHDDGKLFYAFLTTFADKLKSDCSEKFNTFKSSSFKSKTGFTDLTASAQLQNIKVANLLKDSRPFARLKNWVNGYDPKGEMKELDSIRTTLTSADDLINFTNSNTQVSNLLKLEEMKAEKKTSLHQRQENFNEELRQGKMTFASFTELQDIFPDEVERNEIIERCKNLYVDVTGLPSKPICRI